MSDNIFPNLARGASTGVIQGLELARIRRDRRDSRRRIRLQEETLSTLQNNLNAAQLDADGNPRDPLSLQQEQLNLLTAASVDPNIDLQTRQLIGGQARQLGVNQTNRANTAARLPGAGGSALSAAFGGGATTPSTTATGAPLDGSVAPDLNIAPAATETPAAAPAQTTRRDALRAAGSTPAVPLIERARFAVTDGLEAVDNVIGFTEQGEARRRARGDARRAELAQRQAAVTNPAPVAGNEIPQGERITRRLVGPTGRTTLISSTFTDGQILSDIAQTAEQLIGADGNGPLGATSVQELVGLLEARLRELGVDPAGITSDQFNQLAQEGSLFTIPQG